MNNPDHNFRKAFKSIGGARSLDFLASKIIQEINQERMKKVRMQAVISRTVGVISLAALFPALLNIFNQLQGSGFWNYLSLLFTDTGAVATYWKQFSLSLVEALPLFGLTVVVFLVLAVFISLKFALKDFKRVGMSANLA